jgi:methyltransferase (TIGR00027 family)
MPLENVSDTARWVAVYRAMETERPDALFRDPFARELAGERGEEIVRSMPRARAAAWAMIVRTAVMDELLLDLIARDDIDIVVNLAAGLDARPWRMTLPPSLRWVDVDLPEILDYKMSHIGDARPHCRYEAVSADLTSSETRRDILGRLADESTRGIILSEGLLIYLPPAKVEDLARDLYAAEKFRWWITDLSTPRLLRMMRRAWGRSAEAANAPFLFAPADGAGFFRKLGWTLRTDRVTMAEARRLNREMRFASVLRSVIRFLPPTSRREIQRLSSIVVLERGT